MGDRRDDIHWTLKAPLWLLSMLFWGGAIYMGYRGRTIAMFIAVVLACVFMVWSMYYKDWCTHDADAMAWGQAWNAGSFDTCLRKTWFQF